MILYKMINTTIPYAQHISPARFNARLWNVYELVGIEYGMTNENRGNKKK